jgi:hypothetical protein
LKRKYATEYCYGSKIIVTTTVVVVVVVAVVLFSFSAETYCSSTVFFIYVKLIAHKISFTVAMFATAVGTRFISLNSKYFKKKTY